MRVRCPGCDTPVRLPDDEPHPRVKCPECGKQFRPDAGPPPKDEPPQAERPTRSEADRKSDVEPPARRRTGRREGVPAKKGNAKLFIILGVLGGILLLCGGVVGVGLWVLANVQDRVAKLASARATASASENHLGTSASPKGGGVTPPTATKPINPPPPPTTAPKPSNPPVEEKPVPPEPPRPKPVNPLPESKLGSGDPKVQSVKVSVQGKANQVVPACLTWTADATGFYAIDKGGQAVRRFSFPDMKEEAKLDVGKDCSWLCLSAEGVVLTVGGAQEAWVLDPKSLEKVRTFPVAKAPRVLSALPLSVGYVCDYDPESGGPGWIRVVDLKTGKRLKEHEVKTLGKHSGSHSPVITADGKRLYARGGEQIIQYELDGEKVSYLSASDRLVYGAFNQPNVSADGKLMAAPCGAGNFPPKGSDKKLTGALVFSTENLSDPAIELKAGSPSAVAFDTKAGLIYGHAWEEQLVVMDRDGSVLKSFKVNKDAGKYPNQFLVHPDGWKLLLLVPGGTFGSEGTVYSIELPK